MSIEQLQILVDLVRDAGQGASDLIIWYLIVQCVEPVLTFTGIMIFLTLLYKFGSNAVNKAFGADK